MELRVAVLGAGSWGTTVATLACRNAPTTLWSRRSEIAQEINEQHTNDRYLPRTQLPRGLAATDSIEEAVFLGDHILLFSNSPGTILKEVRVPPPDRPSLEMQRDPKFVEQVREIREQIDRLESSNKAGD